MVEVVEVVVCTIRVVKIKEHLLFYRELSIVCFGDRVVRLIESALKDSAFW